MFYQRLWRTQDLAFNYYPRLIPWSWITGCGQFSLVHVMQIATKYISSSRNVQSQPATAVGCPDPREPFLAAEQFQLLRAPSTPPGILAALTPSFRIGQNAFDGLLQTHPWLVLALGPASVGGGSERKTRNCCD